ncbi:MAG: penicillin-binding protein, partial [Xanthomonadales bacterium]|nr:penicillin-binding protein [Xanthomonadales bacterium]
GEIALCPEGEAVVWRARKSPKLHGTLHRVAARWLVEWDEPDVAGADAWLDPATVAGDGVTLAMRAIDPETDFSYDFQDLAPTRLRACE